MDEKKIRGIKNSVITEELIPKREGSELTYQTCSPSPTGAFEGQVQMSSNTTLQESCLDTVQYPTTKAVISPFASPNCNVSCFRSHPSARYISLPMADLCPLSSRSMS